MEKKGIFYLGRIIKLGILNTDMIFEALTNPHTIVRRGNAWTIINSNKYDADSNKYAYGRLCKFSPETEFPVIDLLKKEEILQPERNVIIASSPFVYIPEHSGIAFLHVGNHIEPQTFIKRFCTIINETHQRFFVECHIDPIVDMRTFAIKLSKLNEIQSISATVHPPNPLFGPLWKNLKEYLSDRKAETLKIQEDSARNEALKTRLPEYVALILQNLSENVGLESRLPDIGDAAILMAADGYGSGSVKGRTGGESVVIKTSETIRNFSFDKDPHPNGLYMAALEIFEKIRKERHMEHGDK